MKNAHLKFTGLLFTALFVASCGGSAVKKDYSKEVDEGSFNGNKYESAALGWKMEFPENWVITSKESLENLDARSKAATGDSVQNTNVKRLLAFQKDFENNFQSTIQLYSGKTEGNYQATKKSIREQIYLGYLDNHIGIDTAASTLKVDGLEFDCFTIKLFDPDQKNYATQLLITRVLAEQYFTVTINSNNTKDSDYMLDLFKKSSFKKRN